MPQPIFRKDYEPSSHLIKTTELDFNLGDHETIVSSRIVFYKNPLRAELKIRAGCMENTKRIFSK